MMYNYQAPLRDIQFSLFELHDAPSAWRALGIDSEVNAELASAVLDGAAQLAGEVLAPLNRVGDERKATWKDGEVSAPQGFKEAYQTFREGGWMALSGKAEYGAQGMPQSLAMSVNEMVSGSNVAFALYPGLTAGVCVAMNAFADAELKSRYLPKLYEGVWTGTMCLTEAHAGTDLGMLRTRASDNGDGSYALRGTKIFITAGEHDLSENIVHLVLARIEGAPEGSAGISMFLVPKFLPDDNGDVGPRNALRCASIESKMGLHASPTCVLEFEGATGFLVGEPHRGLQAMFAMMNHERLAVGLQGLACAEAAYQKARAYANERLQGRALSGPVAAEQAADPIIVHPDVRRMLLIQKAWTEGMRALGVYVSLQADIAERSDDAEAATRAGALVSLLTPVVKTFFTDKGFECCVLAQQVFGGHGYIREWGLEQYVRDARIAQIYEGTNGVQAMDLMGRKVARNNGAFVEIFVAEARAFAQRADSEPMREFVEPLNGALDALEEATATALSQAAEDIEAIGAAAYDYCHLFGYIAVAWMWAMTAERALARAGEPFYDAKLHTARFFVQRLLPQRKALVESLAAGPGSIMAMPADSF